MCCLLSRRIKRQAMSCERWCFTQGAGRDHGTAVLDMLLTATTGSESLWHAHLHYI